MKALFRPLAIGTALAVTGTLALTATPALAGTGPVTYSCKVTNPLTITTAATVSYDTNLPARMYLGDADFVADVDGKGAVPKSAMDQARQFYSAYYVQGSSALPFTWNGKSILVTTDTGRRVISETSDTPLDKLYEDILTVPTPTAPGTYQLRLAKEYKSTNALYKKDGSLAFAPVATCTRSADVLVDTVEVWAKATTTLSLPSTSLTVGQTSTVTATITSPGATPAGTVDFMIDGTKVSAPVNNGKATAAFPAKPEGEYTVGATYLPSGAMVEAQAVAPVTVSVGRAATTTSLSLNPARVVQGKALSARVKVTSPAGTPDGTVEVSVGERTFSGALVGGEAEVALPTDLAVGTHSAAATYTPGGSGAFKPSVSEALEFSVREPATPSTTALTLNTGSAEAGQPVQATVTVSSAIGAPAGTVRVQAGARSVSGPLVDGKAELTLPTLAVGTYDVAASFTAADSEVYDNSQSPVVPLTITPAANVIGTTTSLTLVKSTVRAGVVPQAVVYVNTDSAGGLPDGEVELAIDGHTRSGAVVDGVAHVDLPLLAPGRYPVDAVFQPANPGAYADSVSTVRQLVVEAAPSRTDLTLNKTRAAGDETVTATVKVSGTDAAGAPSGSAQVLVNGIETTAPLVSGQAVVTLPALSAGVHNVQAKYLPAAHGWLLGSAAPAVDLTVVPAPLATVTVLTLDRGTVTAGQRVRVTAQVSAAQGNPAGMVTFAVAGSTVQVPVVNGAASWSIPPLPVGTHQVSAGFAPTDARDFTASGAQPAQVSVLADRQVVAPAIKTTTAVSVPRSVGFGGTFTVTATVAGSGATGSVLFTSAWGAAKAPVVNGRAVARMKGTAIGTQPVAAEFVPADASRYTGSVGTAAVAVTKLKSRTTVRVSVSRAKKLVTVRTKTLPVDQYCGGKVTVQVKRGAKSVKKLVLVPTCAGVAKTSLALPKKKGKYTVTASFAGTGTVLASQATRSFKR